MTTTTAPDLRDQLSAAHFKATFLGLELADARADLAQDTGRLRDQLDAERHETAALRAQLNDTQELLLVRTAEVADLRLRLADAEAAQRTDA